MVLPLWIQLHVHCSRRWGYKSLRKKNAKIIYWKAHLCALLMPTEALLPAFKRNPVWNSTIIQLFHWSVGNSVNIIKNQSACLCSPTLDQCPILAIKNNDRSQCFHVHLCGNVTEVFLAISTSCGPKFISLITDRSRINHKWRYKRTKLREGTKRSVTSWISMH